MLSDSTLRRRASFVAALFAASLAGSRAYAANGTVAVTASEAGKTPAYIGYSMAHYLPGSNTSAWVDYADVNAFRVWTSPGDYEPSDDTAPFGDGVTNVTSFDTRKANLRADPTNPTYIDFSKFDARFKTFVQDGRNKVVAHTTLTDLKTRGITPVVELSRSTAWTMTTWAGKWEQWQHTYAMAYYMGKNYDVSRFQTYNEPDQTTSPVPQAEWIERLKIASDAIRSAIADVNRDYGKTLVPDVCAPVTINGASKIDTWGKAALEMNRTDYHGNTVAYDQFNTFDVHRYGAPGATFAQDMAIFKTKIPQYNPSGAMMPVQYTEFNRRNSSSYAGSSDTPDTPAMFLGLADNYLGAMSGGVNGMYVFKFSQTLWDHDSDSSTPDVLQKTGVHFVNHDYDKNSNPNGKNDITGATRSAGVVRLAAKAFKGARPRMNATVAGGISGYSASSSYDASKGNYYLFGLNESGGAHNIEYDLSTWNVEPGTMVSVEEVSSFHHGEVTRLIEVPLSRKISLSQPLQSVWLLTAPQGAPQQQLTLALTADARVRNSAGTGPGFRTTNYGGLTTARVGRTDGTAADPTQFDYATYLKFGLGGHDIADISRAIFQISGKNIDGSTGGLGSGSILFHVYAISDDSWLENQITWANAPNLSDTDAQVEGVGSSAFVAGHLTFDATGGLWGVDLTDLLQTHPELFANDQLSLALVREQRFAGDVDATNKVVELLTRESGTATAPVLNLFVVPEPGSMALAGMALFGVLARRRR